MAKKPNTFNSLANFLVLGILIYAIVSTYFKPHDQNQIVAKDGTLYTESKSPTSFDQWTKLIGLASNSVQPLMDMVSETKGTGSNLVCGQKVTYEYSDKAIGAESYAVKNEKVTFKLGDKPVIEGHLHALAGMQVGGERTVRFSSRWGYEKGPKELIRQDLESHIKLISAVPPVPDSSMPYRIFYSEPHSVLQETFDCGERVRAKFELWTIGGTRLYPPEKQEPEWITLTIGHGQVPVGIEEVLQKISKDESATVILPYELLEYFGDAKEGGQRERYFTNVVFPKNQAILVDIKNVEAIESTTADSPGAQTESTPADKAPPAAETKP